LIFFRFALRALALAGRRPWFAFLILCCGFAIDQSREYKRGAKGQQVEENSSFCGVWTAFVIIDPPAEMDLPARFPSEISQPKP
jgi:phosphatidylglycerophosphate synthase